MFNLTQINSCDVYCAQKIVDVQYEAIRNIYTRFNTFLLSMIIFLILYVILEKIIIANKEGVWKINYIIGSKSIQFHVSDDFINVISMARGVLFGIILATTLIYYFMGRMS